MLPDALQDWLDQHGHGAVTESRSISGGCINQTSVIQCSDGREFFLKQNSSVAADMFAGEAAGLDAMRQAGGPLIPEVYCFDSDFLLMAYLPPGPQQSDYWQRFGSELAMMHDQCSAQFGFNCATYCGSTLQDNRWHNDGHVFFAEQRLLHLARLNRDSGQLNKQQAADIEALCDQLAALVPAQPASLLHGDLWSGNAHTGPDGQPSLIDPAVYYGWAEADLAMTAMFGSFPEEFYHAYTDVRPLADGWRQRFDIYNLYHYLNHLFIFGSSYLSGVVNTCKRYVG